MPTVTDYNSLAKAITDVQHRQDLQAFQDYFIQAAQEQLQNDLFDLNFGNGVRFQENDYPPTPIANGSIPVPTDYLSPKIFMIQDGAGNQFPLIFKDPSWLYDRYPLQQATGLPAYIARDSSSGTNLFVFGPYPDSAYTVLGTYYQAASLLTTQTPTNWMTVSCPWALHAACMVEVGKFLIDDELIARWTPVYQGRLKALVDADKAERWADATMQIETA